jgi:hypothetical protein
VLNKLQKGNNRQKIKWPGTKLRKVKVLCKQPVTGVSVQTALYNKENASSVGGNDGVAQGTTFNKKGA